MVRKQVYIEPEQEALLKRRAAELGITESALIRRGIDAVSRETLQTDGADEVAWQDELAFIEERARTLLVTGGERSWSREEMYDERWNRRLSEAWS